VAPARRRPRLTSIDAFGFGVGWDWIDSEGEIIRRLIVFLEDRRALFEDYAFEVPSDVVSSVLQIRSELTKTLQQLSEGSGAAHAVRALRDTCINFLRSAERPRWGPTFNIALGELRGVFSVYVVGLADRYGILIHGPLAAVVEVARPVEGSEYTAEA
jgi:hypothetical protein